MKTFSRELGNRRQKARLSLRELEKATGVSHSALNRYERGCGLMEMSLRQAIAISKFFGWEFNEIARLVAREASARRKAGGEIRAKVPSK